MDAKERRDWYSDYLEKYYFELLENPSKVSEAGVDAFLRELTYLVETSTEGPEALKAA